MVDNEIIILINIVHKLSIEHKHLQSSYNEKNKKVLEIYSSKNNDKFIKFIHLKTVYL